MEFVECGQYREAYNSLSNSWRLSGVVSALEGPT